MDPGTRSPGFYFVSGPIMAGSLISPYRPAQGATAYAARNLGICPYQECPYNVIQAP